jgi:hypothetical protein
MGTLDSWKQESSYSTASGMNFPLCCSSGHIEGEVSRYWFRELD